MKEVKSNVSMPFQVNADEQGNAKNETPEILPTVEPEKKRRKRRTKVSSAKTFVVAGKNGTSVCDEDGLLGVMSGYEGVPAPEIFVVGAKVKAITVIPGKRNLLEGTAEKDSLEITYE